MRILFLLVILWSSLEALPNSPTHISIVNMELDTNKLEINYSIHLYQADVVKLITQLYHKELFHQDREFNIDQNPDKIEKYFTSNLEVIADGEKLHPTLLTIKSEEIDYWLYYTIPLSANPHEITIRNTILLQLFSDQTNLLIFSFNDKEKGLTFGVNNTEHVLLPD